MKVATNDNANNEVSVELSHNSYRLIINTINAMIKIATDLFRRFDLVNKESEGLVLSCELLLS